MNEVIARIKDLIGRGHKVDVEEYKSGKVVGRSGAKIRANIKNHEASKIKAAKPVRRRTAKASPFSFSDVAIPDGAKLVFIPAGVEVVVVSDKEIGYKTCNIRCRDFARSSCPTRTHQALTKVQSSFHIKVKPCWPFAKSGKRRAKYDPKAEGFMNDEK